MPTEPIKRSKEQQRWAKKFGPWAVVTGASSGIGKALAKELAVAGLNVVLVARRHEALRELAEDLEGKWGVETRVVAKDLGQEDEVYALLKELQSLDVGLLVASAGFGTSGSFLASSLQQELDMLNVNCRALTMLSHQIGQRMVQRGRGGIVLLSSIVGFQGMPNAAHYAATKAYVQSLAEALHVELQGTGVNVLSAAPGPTQSGFAARADMKMGSALQPENLVRPILRALDRGQTTVLPGFLSKLLTYSLAYLPRYFRVRIMGQVMHSMTRHQTQVLPVAPEGPGVSS